jgi:hypothetical protein
MRGSSVPPPKRTTGRNGHHAISQKGTLRFWRTSCADWIA